MLRALAGAWGAIIVFIVKAVAGKNRKRALGREDGRGQSSGGRSVREVVMAPPSFHFGIETMMMMMIVVIIIARIIVIITRIFCIIIIKV